MKALSRYVLLGVALFIAGGLVAGCGGTGGTNPRLRFVHGAPDVGQVDVRANTDIIGASVLYGRITGQRLVDTGTVQIRVWNAGTTTDVLSPTNFTSTRGNNYTSIMTGFATPPQGRPPLTLLVLTDDRTLPTQGNQYRIRFAHAAPSFTLLDVYLTAPGADINTATPSFTNLNFGNASNYQQFTAGLTQIRVTAAGTKAPVLYDSVSTSFLGNQIRSIVLLDKAGGNIEIVTLDDRN